MEPLETMFRKKNIRFFLGIVKESTVVAAAKKSGIGRQHATRLARRWRECGWIERKGLYASKYRYTGKGESIQKALYRMGWFP